MWNSIYLILKSCKGVEIAIMQFFIAQRKDYENPIFLTKYYRDITSIINNILKPFNTANDQCLDILYLIACLILDYIIEVSFIFKDDGFHSVFRDIARQIKKKLKKY